MLERTRGSKPDAYVNSLIAAKDRPSVEKARLANFRSLYPDGPILALEGEDDKVVYSYWVGRAAPDFRFEMFLCGGKRGACNLKLALSRDLGGLSKNVAFMVDRDFDGLRDFIDATNVFVLDRYSIENYLVDEEALGKSIAIAYPLHGQPHKVEAIQNIFRSDYDCFLAISRELNLRIFVARQLRLPIDDIVPETITTFSSIRISNVNAKPCDFCRLLPLEPSPSEESLAQLSAQFKLLDPRTNYRGKFAFKFLRLWLNSLAEEYKDPSLGLFGGLATTGARVKHDELSMDALAARSSIPFGMLEFIKSSFPSEFVESSAICR